MLISDEWGKLLGIETAEENDAEQLSVAEMNPLRYRGYYYDSETGMYYLQSRYYDPSICRFINADIPEIIYITKDSAAGTNLFAYCCNDPVNYVDKTGYASTASNASAANSLFWRVLAEVLSGLGAFAMSILAPLIIVCAIVVAIMLLFSGDTRKTDTKILSDIMAKKQNGRHYKIAYINNSGTLIKIGNKLTFVQALAALGITASSNDISRRYKFSYNKSTVSQNVKKAYNSNKNKWGIYADTQSAAKALAVVLGSTEPPEVHGSGYYGHYHDKNHNIHIWYGSSINY